MFMFLSGSEDFGLLGTAAGCPSVFWHIGGFDPARYTIDDRNHLLAEGTLPAHLPGNHSPHCAPDPVPALPAKRAA